MKKITFLLLLVGSQWLSAQVTANPASDILMCDINNNGFATFDLSVAETEIIGSQTDVQVTFHINFADASNGTSPLPSNIYNNVVPYGETIYARIESTVTTDFATSSFELVVEPLPSTTTPSPIVLIDSDGDGYEVFDLTIRELNIVAPSPDIVISYFETLADAEMGTNAIANPFAYQNTVTPVQTIYVRVEDMNTGCYAIEPLDIVVDTIPTVPAVIEDDYVVFDANGDGFAIFDLTVLIPQIIGTQTGLEVTFYETEVDAQNKTNGVDDPEVYENITNPQIMYARSETVHGTFALTSFTIFADENLSSPSFGLEALTFYPNPAQDFIHFDRQGDNNEYAIEIFSLKGQVVLTQNDSSEVSQTGKLDVSRLNPGIYLLKITSGNKQITKQLIKK